MKHLVKLFILLITVTNSMANAQKVEEVVVKDVEVVEAVPPRDYKPNAVDQKGYFSSRYNRYYVGKSNLGYQIIKDRLEKNTRYGLLNIEGKLVLPFIFKSYESISNSNLVILRLGNLRGVFNLETLTWNIPVQYKSINYINDDMLVVSKNNLKGVVDFNGTVIEPLRWYNFQKIYGLDHYFKVSKERDGLQGIFNLLAKDLVIPMKYKSLKKISDTNIFIIKKEDDTYNLSDSNGNLLFKNWYTTLTKNRKVNSFIASKNGLFGIIDYKEKPLAKFEYTAMKTSGYGSNYIITKNKANKYGILDVNGTVVFPFDYDNLASFSDNSNYILTSKQNQCGVLKVSDNGDLKEILTCDYDDATYADKVFIITKNKKKGLINLDGQELIPTDYDAIIKHRINYNYQLYVAEKNNTFFIFNSAGLPLNKKGFKALEYITDNSKETYYSYTKKFNFFKFKETDKGNYGVLDKTGSIVVPPKFNTIIGEYNNNIIFETNGKKGIYNLISKKITLPAEYDMVLLDNNTKIAAKANTYFSLSLSASEVKTKPL